MTEVNYTRLGWESNQHHLRYAQRVESQPRKLVCQECGGAGECDEDVILGHTLTISCGYCEGTGLQTPHMRGLWLRDHRTSAAK